jgi:hypothetical protein
MTLLNEKIQYNPEEDEQIETCQIIYFDFSIK